MTELEDDDVFFGTPTEKEIKLLRLFSPPQNDRFTQTVPCPALKESSLDGMCHDAVVFSDCRFRFDSLFSCCFF